MKRKIINTRKRFRKLYGLSKSWSGKVAIHLTDDRYLYIHPSQGFQEVVLPERFVGTYERHEYPNLTLHEIEQTKARLQLHYSYLSGFFGIKRQLEYEAKDEDLYKLETQYKELKQLHSESIECQRLEEAFYDHYEDIIIKELIKSEDKIYTGSQMIIKYDR